MCASHSQHPQVTRQRLVIYCEGQHQIVKWSAIVEPQNAPYVHHFVVYGCLFDES